MCPDSLSCLLAALCLFEIDFLPVQWMPWQLKLMSSTCIRKRRANCQGINYREVVYVSTGENPKS